MTGMPWPFSRQITPKIYLRTFETVADARLQPAVEPQGRRGLEASRPQCAIRIHQRQGDCGTGRGATGHLGRHQEERADRQLQEWWQRLSPERRSAAREGARLRG